MVISGFSEHKIVLKKGSKKIYFFYLRKLSRFWGKFCTALIQNNILHKKCQLLMKYITFFSKFKKNVFRFFFMQFYAIKTCDKLSANIDHCVLNNDA